mmetsp:Transcript_2919/g.8309  ORF Transcript_2919/g.8309 Transcript_2919/m.8309 type:complete len:548 (+) Transcript_2919:89-1732(+)
MMRPWSAILLLWAQEAACTAGHVVRLHRLDPGGHDEMREAEERWHRGDFSMPERVAGKYWRLPRHQALSLLEHHEVAMAASSVADDGRRVSGAQRHFMDREQETSIPERAQAVTRLMGISSVHVGPLAVGTKLVPENCHTADGRPPAYVQMTALEGDEAALLQAGSCVASDEASLQVVMDSGSTNLWVAEATCRSAPCLKHNRYNCRRSTSYSGSIPPAPELSIEFGTGEISGAQGVDDVRIGPVTVKTQDFGMIQEEVGEVFSKNPIEGIVGLGLPAMAAQGTTPIMENIIKQKLLKRNLIAFYFSRDNPSANGMFWGGIDPNFYTGPMETFQVTKPYYWSTGLESFKIGGHEMLGRVSPPRRTSARSGLLQLVESESVLTAEEAVALTSAHKRREMKAVLDTGTSYFSAGSGLFRRIMRRLPVAMCSAITSESHPPITFRMRNIRGEPRDYAFDNRHYMVASSPDADSECHPAFMQVDLPPKEGPGMILGHIFFTEHLVAFDRADGDPNNAVIHVARARKGSEVQQHLANLTRHQPKFRVKAHAD